MPRSPFRPCTELALCRMLVPQGPGLVSLIACLQKIVGALG